MQLMDFKAWIEGLPGSPLVTQAAEKAGIDRSTISRQLKRGLVSAENVIALARAYGAPAGQALIDTGYLTARDLEGVGVVAALGRASNQQLLEEIMQRIDPSAVRIFDGGADVITPRFGNTNDDEEKVEEQRWAARRSDMPSPGEALHKRLDGLGEESQLGPDDD